MLLRDGVVDFAKSKFKHGSFDIIYEYAMSDPESVINNPLDNYAKKITFYDLDTSKKVEMKTECI